MWRSPQPWPAPMTPPWPWCPKDPMSSRSSPDEALLPSPDSLAIHLDLVGGISGDMFVAAMVDALPFLAGPVMAELARMQAPGASAPEFVETSSGGLRARRFGLAPAPYRSVRGPVSVIAGAAHEDAGTPYASL